MNDRERIADYLDGLLDGKEAADVEALIARDPQLLDEVSRWRERLYSPCAVAPPPDDLAQRIVARHRRRPRIGVLRYAAAFLAGVTTTLLIQSSPPEPEPDAKPAQHEPVVYDNIRLR